MHAANICQQETKLRFVQSVQVLLNYIIVLFCQIWLQTNFIILWFFPLLSFSAFSVNKIGRICLIVNLLKTQIWLLSSFYSSIFTGWEFLVFKGQLEWSLRTLNHRCQVCKVLPLWIWWWLWLKIPRNIQVNGDKVRVIEKILWSYGLFF